MVAFSPTDIKSATDNTGKFDRANVDVRYSKRDASTNDTVFACSPHSWGWMELGVSPVIVAELARVMVVLLVGYNL